MNVTLMSSTAWPDKLCGEAAAVCTDSTKYESALRHAVEAGHTSVLEHAVFTFQVEGLSRAALAQLTRHRLASFDVQSQRYVKLNNYNFVVPESVEKSQYADEANELVKKCMEFYQKLLADDVPAEDARYYTQQGITTKLVMTMNARELLHFFSLRTCNRAQWEIRELADKMLKICRKQFSAVFDNAGPGCVTGYCPEKRPCGHPRSKEDWTE